MAPECIQKGRYSEKSDVWAFGVLAWELLTDGMIPFAEFVDTNSVAAEVVGGRRLVRPAECTDDMLWEIVTACWSADPHSRPTFAELVIKLGRVNWLARVKPNPPLASAPSTCAESKVPSAPTKRALQYNTPHSQPRQPFVSPSQSSSHPECAELDIESQGSPLLRDASVDDSAVTPQMEGEVKQGSACHMRPKSILLYVFVLVSFVVVVALFVFLVANAIIAVVVIMMLICCLLGAVFHFPNTCRF